MLLAITVLLILVVAVLGLIGYIRDVRRGVVALAGTLMGANLVAFWGEPLGRNMAESLGGRLDSYIFLSSILIFTLTVGLVGYGGGSLLGKTKGPLSFQRRFASSLLGMLNGVLIVAYLVRFSAANNPEQQALLRTTPVTQILHDGLPLMFLLFAMVVGSLVVIRTSLILISRATKPEPILVPQQGRPGQPQPGRPGQPQPQPLFGRQQPQPQQGQARPQQGQQQGKQQPQQAKQQQSLLPWLRGGAKGQAQQGQPQQQPQQPKPAQPQQQPQYPQQQPPPQYPQQPPPQYPQQGQYPQQQPQYPQQGQYSDAPTPQEWDRMMNPNGERTK
ncbi:MAG: hypothetical protein OHK0022_39420 [Roseiflexaceae bacterium]